MLKCICQPNNAYIEFEMGLFKCKWQFGTSSIEPRKWTDDPNDPRSFHFWVYTEEETQPNIQEYTSLESFRIAISSPVPN